MLTLSFDIRYSQSRYSILHIIPGFEWQDFGPRGVAEEYMSNMSLLDENYEFGRELYNIPLHFPLHEN